MSDSGCHGVEVGEGMVREETAVMAIMLLLEGLYLYWIELVMWRGVLCNVTRFVKTQSNVLLR